MNVGFSRHDGLGGERSNSQHKGQERYEGAPPFPTICPQTQHFFVKILWGRFSSLPSIPRSLTKSDAVVLRQPGLLQSTAARVFHVSPGKVYRHQAGIMPLRSAKGGYYNEA